MSHTKGVRHRATAVEIHQAALPTAGRLADPSIPTRTYYFDTVSPISSAPTCHAQVVELRGNDAGIVSAMTSIVHGTAIPVLRRGGNPFQQMPKKAPPLTITQFSGLKLPIPFSPAVPMLERNRPGSKQSKRTIISMRMGRCIQSIHQLPSRHRMERALL